MKKLNVYEKVCMAIGMLVMGAICTMIFPLTILALAKIASIVGMLPLFATIPFIAYAILYYTFKEQK